MRRAFIIYHDAEAWELATFYKLMFVILSLLDAERHNGHCRVVVMRRHPVAHFPHKAGNL